jgi:hypothetical protein
MSNTRETGGGRKRVGPEDEAREDQMDDQSLGPAEGNEDEPALPNTEDQLARTVEAGMRS